MLVQELKDALRAKGVSFSNSTTKAELENLYATHCVQNEGTSQQSQVVADTTNATTDTDDAIEKIIVNGKELDAFAPNSERIEEILKKKQANSFPNFVGKLPDGIYTTVGKVVPYAYQSENMKTPSTLLLVLLENAQGEKFAVGTWDLTKRAFGIRLADGSDVNPAWVCNEDYSSNAERDRLAVNLPAGIKVEKKSNVGHWNSGKSERNYFIAWLEKPSEE